MQPNKNLKRDVKAMYFGGIPLADIASKHRLTMWNLNQMINSIIASHPSDTKADRIQRAKTMEANIFELIEKKQPVDHLVNAFARYCAYKNQKEK